MYRIFGSLFFIIFFFAGCNTLFQSTEENSAQKSTEDNVITEQKELTEREKLKYKFAFIEGMKQKALENYSKSISYFYKCLDLKPNAAAVQYQISLINNLLEETNVALRYAKKAIDNDPANKYYREHIFQLYLRTNQPKKAITQYEYLLDLGLENIDYYYDLAQLYRRTGQYKNALEMLNELEDRAGMNEQILVLKKVLYTKTGNKDKAIAETKKLIQNFPDDTRYYGMLAELYASYGEYEKAEAMYDKLFKLDSTNNLGQISLVKYYTSKQLYDKALDQYLKVIDHNQIDFGTKFLVFMNFLEKKKVYQNYPGKMKRALDSLDSNYPDRYEVHTLYTDFFLKTNRYPEAALHLEKLVSSKHEKPPYWRQLLSIYSYTGNFQKMFLYGTRALEKYKQEPRFYLLAGIGAIQNNKSDTAVIILKEGLKTLKDQKEMKAQFYGQLGQAYHNLKNHTRSDRYFEKVMELEPGNVFVANNYSYYLSVRGEKLQRAQELSKKTVKKHPQNSIYLDTYAWVLYKLERYKKAEKYIKKAIKHSGSKDPEVLEHYGDILFRNGKKEEALKQWKQSKEYGNTSKQIQLKIEKKQIPE